MLKLNRKINMLILRKIEVNKKSQNVPKINIKKLSISYWNSKGILLLYASEVKPAKTKSVASKKKDNKIL